MKSKITQIMIAYWYMIDKEFVSHLRPRYDKKWKIHQSKFENPEKKSKIFGLENYELDMLDTVFRPQKHDALGQFFLNGAIWI